MIFLYGIEVTDKPNFIFKLFNRIQLRGNRIILPIQDELISCKKAQKLAKKTKQMLDKTISKRIVLSEKIKRQEEYVNFLHTYDFDIIEGKWLFQVLSTKVLDFVLEKKEMKKEETPISILVNDLTEVMLSEIRKIAKEYKRVNIITNHREKFKKIEEQILEEDGIMITVGNNKRKGLMKSKLIVNVDFPSELVNQYHIYENAIVINLRGNVEIEKKRFNGICINDYDIEFQSMDVFEDEKNTPYKACELYEAQMNKRQPFSEIMKQLDKDKVKITKLVGRNTIL